MRDKIIEIIGFSPKLTTEQKADAILALERESNQYTCGIHDLWVRCELCKLKCQENITTIADLIGGER